MGHAEAFSGGDAVARFMAMRGHNVLHPIGWDAFGLPAENAAIKRGIHPKEWTYANIEQQAASFRRLGMSFDWTRRLDTCDPEYYRWTQWLFLQLFERGLAYRKTAADELVPEGPDGPGERAGDRRARASAAARRSCARDLTQWFFKITDYAQRLLDDMDELDGLARARAHDAAQLDRPVRGRARSRSRSPRRATRSTVFTTRPDTLWGVTFFVFALEHPLVMKLAEAGGTAGQVEALLERLAATPLTNREEADTPRGRGARASTR